MRIVVAAAMLPLKQKVHLETVQPLEISRRDSCQEIVIEDADLDAVN